MRLEKRQTLSRSAFVIAPLCALAATMLVAAALAPRLMKAVKSHAEESPVAFSRAITVPLTM